MAVGYGLEDFFTQPFPACIPPPASGDRRGKNVLVYPAKDGIFASLQHKCQQIFMAAFSTFHPCEAIMGDASVQVAVDE